MDRPPQPPPIQKHLHQRAAITRMLRKRARQGGSICHAPPSGSFVDPWPAFAITSGNRIVPAAASSPRLRKTNSKNAFHQAETTPALAAFSRHEHRVWIAAHRADHRTGQHEQSLGLERRRHSRLSDHESLPTLGACRRVEPRQIVPATRTSQPGITFHYRLFFR